MAQRGLSLIMLALALLGIADGWRLQASERGQTLFDDIGPDRYLMGLSALLALLSVCLLLQRQQAEGRTETSSEHPTKAGTETNTAGALALVPPHALAVTALVAYAAALPWLGYVVATLFFMIAAFRLAGVADWLRSTAFGALATGLAYWIFVRASDVPLPTGWLSRFIG